MKTALLLLLLLLVATGASAKKVCTGQLSHATEAALSAFKIPSKPAAGDKAWAQYKALVDRYGVCDDGVLGEFYSDTKIWMLGKQWDAAMRFKPLQTGTAFRAFVERFTGGSSTAEDIAIVGARAVKHCDVPAATAFCRRIRKLTAPLPRELMVDPRPEN